jgi:hypothetical protein
MVTNNSRATLKGSSLPDACGAGKRLAHASFALRVAVLVVFQGVENGAELPIAGGLEVFQGVGCACELYEAPRQPRALAGGQDAPGEEPDQPLLGAVGVGFESVFEEVVELLSLRQGQPEVDRSPLALAQRVFST